MPQPDLILTPFAQDAPPSAVDNIPEVRSPSDPLEKATWTQGFPGLTMIPLAAGGIPPRGQDVNGVLKAISEHTVFQGGGGQYKWSAEYVAAHGGYSQGAVLQSDDGAATYVSAIDNNTVNFNTTPSAIGNQWFPAGGAPKANSSLTISAGAGLTGGGNLTQNRQLAVQFGTTAGTAAQGDDSRIVNAVPNSRTVNAGAGLGGGGNLSANRTLFVDFASKEQAQELLISNKVISPLNLGQAMNAHVLGMGQTWQNVTGSRVAGTTYTNTTGRTIAVKILVGAIAAGQTTSRFFVNGSEFSLGTSTVANETVVHEAILPSGGTYMLSAVSNTTIIRWMELR